MQYRVIFESFAERHYMRSFAKKYKGAWNFTYKQLCDEFEQFDFLFLKSAAETIVDAADIKICKTEFKVAGTQESRRSSGNRCIVAIRKEKCEVRVLLVYTKTDLSGHNETIEWKQIVKDNYPEYHDLL